MTRTACGVGDMEDPAHRAVCITCNGAYRRGEGWRSQIDEDINLHLRREDAGKLVMAVWFLACLVLIMVGYQIVAVALVVGFMLGALSRQLWVDQ